MIESEWLENVSYVSVLSAESAGTIEPVMIQVPQTPVSSIAAPIGILRNMAPSAMAKAVAARAAPLIGAPPTPSSCRQWPR